MLMAPRGTAIACKGSTAMISQGLQRKRTPGIPAYPGFLSSAPRFGTVGNVADRSLFRLSLRMASSSTAFRRRRSPAKHHIWCPHFRGYNLNHALHFPRVRWRERPDPPAPTRQVRHDILLAYSSLPACCWVVSCCCRRVAMMVMQTAIAEHPRRDM